MQATVTGSGAVASGGTLSLMMKVEVQLWLNLNNRRYLCLLNLLKFFAYV